MAPEHLEDAARVLEGEIAFRVAQVVAFIQPRLRIVSALGFVPTGEIARPFFGIAKLGF